ncbi:superfamily II DNA/RNA helicase [Elusimicrobium posterum]|uniref:DEAD/DEAH box helicase n=1 Tax=Elusimicrobium posterum TaxID=3116653 RepID=UPI003C745B04
MTNNTTFESLNLEKDLLSAVTSMGITIPTEIQAKVIPQALQNKDILGTSKTGTGKTLAFLIPLFTYLKHNDGANALILAPTRELAIQIDEVIKELFNTHIPYRMAVLVGGANMQRQLRELEKKPRIIIGTAGRIRDHLQQKSLDFSKTSFVVLDETDRMLDMGFIDDINVFISMLPKKRQMMLFSATMPPTIEKLAKTYMHEPVRISVGETHTAHELISQNHRMVDSKEKQDVLVEELNKRGGSTIVFVKTKYIAQRLCKALVKQGFNAGELHSNMTQNQRKGALTKFRNEKTDVLVATDLASRGLDIDHIQNVINYDVPHTPHDYIHRVGRTGRAGRDGFALTLVSNEDKGRWKDVCNLLYGKEKKTEAKKHNRVLRKMKEFQRNPQDISSRPNRWEKKDSRKAAAKPTEVKAAPAPKAEVAKAEPKQAVKEERQKQTFEKRERPQRDFKAKRDFKKSEGRFERKSERNSEQKFERKFEKRSEGRFERKPEGRFERKSDRKDSFRKFDDKKSFKKDFRKSDDRKPSYKKESYRDEKVIGTGYKKKSGKVEIKDKKRFGPKAADGKKFSSGSKFKDKDKKNFKGKSSGKGFFSNLGKNIKKAAKKGKKLLAEDKN